MPKLKVPLLSFSATGPLSKLFSFRKRGKQTILENKPIPTDARSPAQLIWRHMYYKCANLWHDLSEAEQQEWQLAARPKHMSGYAWFMSQCLRPNPGIYLPLQGGTMQGDIDMASFRILDLIDPTLDQEPVTKKYYEDNLPTGAYTEGARVKRSANLSVSTNSWTTVNFDQEDWDTDNIHDNVTDNERLTCKTPGKYLVIANAHWNVNNVGPRGVRLTLNGAVVPSQWSGATTPSGGLICVILTATIMDLAVDDYITMLAYQSSGNTLVLNNFQTRFMMHRIG